RAGRRGRVGAAAPGVRRRRLRARPDRRRRAPGGGPVAPGGVVAVAQQDTLDAADVAQFVRDHAESAATQPLADTHRQRMMSAEIAGAPVLDDELPGVVANTD